MQLRISDHEGVPIYLQLVRQIKYLVSTGQLTDDQQLPPVRKLAEQLTINPNTVARAYRELEREGILVIRQGSGVYVADTGSPLARRERQRILLERIDMLLSRSTTDESRSGFAHRPRAPTWIASEGAVQMNESIVSVQNLSRRFRHKIALADLSCEIVRGRVLSLLGENGAGKTTLIKHLLGLYAAQTGTVRVFGHDPVREPAATLSHLGYLSEDRDLPGWMRVDELLDYTRAFYPRWDASYAAELLREFDLPPRQKIRTLSRGMLARVGLLVAVAHRPDLLILDEPSSGLDPGEARHPHRHRPHRRRRRSHRALFITSAA